MGARPGPGWSTNPEGRDTRGVQPLPGQSSVRCECRADEDDSPPEPGHGERRCAASRPASGHHDVSQGHRFTVARSGQACSRIPIWSRIAQSRCTRFCSRVLAISNCSAPSVGRRARVGFALSAGRAQLRPCDTVASRQRRTTLSSVPQPWSMVRPAHRVCGRACSDGLPPFHTMEQQLS